MLIPRIITGIILILLALLLIFYVSPIVFLLVTAAVTLLGAFEWANLIGVKNLIYKILYGILTALFMVLTCYFSIPVFLLLGIVFVWWIIAGILVATYPATAASWSRGVYIRGLMGILSLVPAWWSINVIRQFSEGSDLSKSHEVLLFAFLLIWAADIGAYFVGRWWGKHKLMPAVSPNKTWEGFGGGILFAIFITVLFCIFMQFDIQQSIYFLILSIIVVIFSVVGDLFESMLKRVAGVKDSGTILPGHGGVLDRMDSLLAGAPVFLLGCFLLKWLF
jgi:phosphatidate cytidylyltransferase